MTIEIPIAAIIGGGLIVGVIVVILVMISRQDHPGDGNRGPS